MASNSSIKALNLVPLDFSTLKQQIINNFSSQSIFKGYNFEGSNFNVLIDELARNGFLYAFYLNMVASEMFLDSAQMHDSIVSHAKELNYTPRSCISSEITGNIIINTNDPSQTSVFIPKYTTFTGRIGSNSYSFSTNSNIVAISTNQFVSANGVSIFEGDLTTDVYNMDYSNSNQRFILSNANADTTGLNVIITEDTGANVLFYQLATSLFGLNANSQVYFLQGAESNTYELIFGDDINGRKPLDGALITAEYRATNGAEPNGIANVNVDGFVGGYGNVSFQVTTPAYNGSPAELANSIQFNAPRAFNVQGRAVTSDDFSTILQINFPEIHAITAYGGDEIDPPQYGKVFIAIELNGVDGIPQSKITQYTNWLRDYTSPTITPVFIDPNFLYIGVTTTVKYNLNLTQSDPQGIFAEVANTIADFNDNNLNNFATNLYYSQFCTAIDNADESIVSNETVLRMIQVYTPTVTGSQNFNISFYQSLANNYLNASTSSFSPNEYHTVYTSTFLSNGLAVQIVDDGNGNLLLVQQTQTQYIVISNVGTVDYGAGTCALSGVYLDLINSLNFYGASAVLDIEGNQNVIVNIRPQDVVINIEQVRI